jgi:hypothetical protein
MYSTPLVLTQPYLLVEGSATMKNSATIFFGGSQVKGRNHISHVSSVFGPFLAQPSFLAVAK